MSTFSEIHASHCVAPTQQIPGQHLIAAKQLVSFSPLYLASEIGAVVEGQVQWGMSFSQSVSQFLSLRKNEFHIKKDARIIANYDFSNSPGQPQEVTLRPHQSLLLIGIPKLRRVRPCQDLFNISVTCDMKHFYRTKVWSLPCQVSGKINPLFETCYN